MRKYIDFNIQVDKFIEARRPDIILVRKKKSVSSLISLSRVILEHRWKKMKKIEKYEDLKREISKLWGVQTTVIPIIIGALSTIKDRLMSFLVMVGVSLSFETIQKSALLGSAHILRKVLGIKEWCKDRKDGSGNLRSLEKTRSQTSKPGSPWLETPVIITVIMIMKIITMTIMLIAIIIKVLPYCVFATIYMCLHTWS